MINLLLVMAGGAVGSALRYGIGIALSSFSNSFPFATIVVNIVGSFMLGFIAGTIGTPFEIDQKTKLILGTGLCGGFTTYSAFAVETVALIEQRSALALGTYIIITLVGCLASAWAGIALSRSIASS